jgi:hypothetical protein
LEGDVGVARFEGLVDVSGSRAVGTEFSDTLMHG